MLTEYQSELINEMLLELSRLRECVVVVDESGYGFSEERIKIIAKILKGEQ